MRALTSLRASTYACVNGLHMGEVPAPVGMRTGLRTGVSIAKPLPNVT